MKPPSPVGMMYRHAPAVWGETNSAVLFQTRRRAVLALTISCCLRPPSRRYAACSEFVATDAQLGRHAGLGGALLGGNGGDGDDESGSSSSEEVLRRYSRSVLDLEQLADPALGGTLGTVALAACPLALGGTLLFMSLEVSFFSF